MPQIPTPELVAQLKRHEGFRAEPYTCTAHACTIGYGCNLQAQPRFIPYEHIRELVLSRALKGEVLCKQLRALGMRWSEREAERVLFSELTSCHAALLHRCPPYAALVKKGDTVRAEVLLNMAFNLGVGGLLRFRATLAALERAMSTGDYAPVAAGMLASLWARQVGRRARELARQMESGAWA